MIETLLFVAGINTLLQTVFGTRLPVVMGGSYAFIIPAVSIALSRRFSVYIDPHQVGLIQFVIFLSPIFSTLLDSRAEFMDGKSRVYMEMITMYSFFLPCLVTYKGSLMDLMSCIF